MRRWALPACTQVISFYFEWLVQEKHKVIGSSVLLIPGSTTFLLANSGPMEGLNESSLPFWTDTSSDTLAATHASPWQLTAATMYDPGASR